MGAHPGAPQLCCGPLCQRRCCFGRRLLAQGTYWLDIIASSTRIVHDWLQGGAVRTLTIGGNGLLTREALRAVIVYLYTCGAAARLL